MSRDDYDRIVYEILKELYTAMREAEPVEIERISAEALKIKYGYWANILGKMLDNGLVEGFSIKKYISGKEIIGIEDIDITQDGIHYLKNSKSMKQVVEYLLKIGEIVPKFLINI